MPLTTCYVAAIPASVQTYHGMSKEGQADSVIEGPNRTMVRFNISGAEQDLYPFLRNVTCLYLIYEKEDGGGPAEGLSASQIAAIDGEVD